MISPFLPLLNCSEDLTELLCESRMLLSELYKQQTESEQTNWQIIFGCEQKYSAPETRNMIEAMHEESLDDFNRRFELISKASETYVVTAILYSRITGLDCKTCSLYPEGIASKLAEQWKVNPLLCHLTQLCLPELSALFVNGLAYNPSHRSNTVQQYQALDKLITRVKAVTEDPLSSVDQ